MQNLQDEFVEICVIAINIILLSKLTFSLKKRAREFATERIQGHKTKWVGLLIYSVIKVICLPKFCSTF